jgi:uncharacterized protein
MEIDARPSDSIALALRTKAPIFVSEKIILEETVVDRQMEEQDKQKFKKYIENLKPGDFLKNLTASSSGAPMPPPPPMTEPGELGTDEDENPENPNKEEK